MEMEVILLELYHDKDPALPVPVAAYGMSHDEDRVVVLVYDELRDAA